MGVPGFKTRQPASLTRDTEAFYDALNGLLRHYQYRDRDRSCCGGLSVTECHALEATVQLGSPSITEVGKLLRMNKSTASRVIGALESQGLIERRADPTNHRVWKVSATPKGHARHNAIVADLKDELRALLGGLSDGERARVTVLLQQLTALAAVRISGD